MNKSRVFSLRRRSGMTILETMAVMSMFLLFGIMATGILRAVTELGSRSGGANRVRRSVMRLADRIRTDAKTAEDVAADKGTFPLKIKAKETRIEYELDATGSSLRRSKYHSGELVEVDSFALPSGKSYQISFDDSILSIALGCGEQSACWVIESSIGS